MKTDKLTLDIGCGRKKRGHIGIDVNRSSDADIIVDAHYLPLQSNIVTRVIAFAVLEHVDNPVRVLTEIRRILRDKGKAYLLVPKDSTLKSDYLVCLVNFIIKPYHAIKQILRETKAMRQGEHKWQYTKQSLTKLLKDAGFRIETIKEPTYPWLWVGEKFGKIHHYTRRLRRPNLIVVMSLDKN